MAQLPMLALVSSGVSSGSSCRLRIVFNVDSFALVVQQHDRSCDLGVRGWPTGPELIWQPRPGGLRWRLTAEPFRGAGGSRRDPNG